MVVAKREKKLTEEVLDMNKIMRCITTDGSIMAAAIDSSDIVHIAEYS
ncbi:MAG: hypothetical protein ACLR13_02515 [Acutalibacteraceae bacterium]